MSGPTPMPVGSVPPSKRLPCEVVLSTVDVLQVSASQVGVLAAVAAVATLAGSAYWGWLVDRKSSLEALRVMYLLGATTPLILS